MTDIVQISDIETQKVHKVYEIISDTFNSKRFQHWTWINEFMDSLQLNQQSSTWVVGVGEI